MLLFIHTGAVIVNTIITLLTDVTEYNVLLFCQLSIIICGIYHIFVCLWVYWVASCTQYKGGQIQY